MGMLCVCRNDKYSTVCHWSCLICTNKYISIKFTILQMRWWIKSIIFLDARDGSHGIWIMNISALCNKCYGLHILRGSTNVCARSDHFASTKNQHALRLIIHSIPSENVNCNFSSIISISVSIKHIYFQLTKWITVRIKHRPHARQWSITKCVRCHFSAVVVVVVIFVVVESAVSSIYCIWLDMVWLSISLLPSAQWSHFVSYTFDTFWMRLHCMSLCLLACLFVRLLCHTSHVCIVASCTVMLRNINKQTTHQINERTNEQMLFSGM